jgi:hypothetical protein
MDLGLRVVLVLACLGAALVSGGLVLATALIEAETSLVTALEGKAGVHARTVKQDLEIALNLGQQLDEVRQVSEYLEQGVQDDPDIRFAAVTDLDLRRLYYGGIGRRRLDPLLAAPALREAIDEDPHALSEGVDGVEIEGFSLTATPLMAQGSTVGWVIVSVQNKQVLEQLVLDLMRLLPAAIAILLLLGELAMSTAASAYEDPLRRLGHLMGRVGHDRGIERSGRHDRSEIGIALLRFNGIMHRLADRAQRVLALADEVQRAVFDASIAGQVARRATNLRDSMVKPLLGPVTIRADARASDIQMSLTLMFAASAFGLATIYGGGPAVPLIGPLLGLLVAGLLAALLRSPGWGLVLAGVLQAGSVALWLLAPPALRLPELIAAGLAAAIGASLVASWRFRRRNGAFGPVWLTIRFAIGTLAGILIAWTVVLEGRIAAAPFVVLAAVAMAVAAANRAAVVRTRLFERSAGTG